MNDMSSVIIPKSDQINADDLISGDMMITIREVQIKGGQEQPVSIYFDGRDKAFRPCKSMSRVLVAGWGPDAKAYVGRSLLLYRDPTVKWGGLEVGGIRIKAMSHIDGPMTMALTATKGSRKPYTVKPLTVAQAPSATNNRAKAERWLAGYLADPRDSAANRSALAKLQREYPDLYAQAVPPSSDDDWPADDSQPAATDLPGEATTPEAGAAAAPDLAEGRGDEDMGEHDPFRLAADRLIADARACEIVADLELKGKDKDDFDALPDELQIEVEAVIQEQRRKLGGG